MYTNDSNEPNAPGWASTETGRTIGIRELRTDLSAIIRRASAGDAIVVTQRGIAIAEIGPLGRRATDFERLVATGAVISPRRAGTWRPPVGIAVAAGTRIDQAMRDIRG